MRKHLFLTFVCLSMMTQVYAFSWQDLWVTKNQQAQTMMRDGHFEKAKETFERDDWRASAAYRAGDYEQAARLFQSQHNEEAFYNQGNALAHMGHYEQAIKAYDQALAINPDNQDALHNRKILEELLKKDKQRRKKQDHTKNDQNKQNQQDQKKADQEQKNQAQNRDQNKDKSVTGNQNQENQDQNQQDQEKQSQEKQEQKQDKHQKAKQNKQQPKKDQQKQTATQSSSDREKQQAKEQWLRLIPDDPGGLMREKFLRDHLKRHQRWYP